MRLGVFYLDQKIGSIFFRDGKLQYSPTLSQAVITALETYRAPSMTDEQFFNNLPLAVNSYFSVRPISSDRTDADDSERDLADYLTDKAMDETRQIFGGWLGHIKTWLTKQQEQGRSLSEVHDEIPALYKQLDGTQFSEALAQLLLMSDLAGRDELIDEIAAEDAAEEAEDISQQPLS